MIVGYSYWGYLGDTKYDVNGNVASTPDGNAFYSWSIIKELQDKECDVIQVMPDRDEPAYNKLGKDLFKSFCQDERNSAYTNMKKDMYNAEHYSWPTITRSLITSTSC